MVLLFAVLAQSQSAGEKPQIWGQITNNERGVEAVKVRLESYDGEPCVRLAESTSSLSADQEKVLKKCEAEIGTVLTDAKGEYHFRDVRSGWYRLSMSWNMPADPSERGLHRIGEYIVMFAANEQMAKYLMSAQGSIFRFEGASSVEHDLKFAIAFGK